jgi:cell division protein FtsI (penicillin-binding protein 3)
MASRNAQSRPAKTYGHRVLSPAPSGKGLSRDLVLGGMLAIWMLGLAARLYHLQIIQYVDLLSRAQRQQQRTIEVAPQRGTIFDRQMNPLAMSLGVDSVYAVPSEIPDPVMVARLLAPILGLEANDLLGRFQAFRSFCWVKRKAAAGEAGRVRELNLKGIYCQRETKRFYPKGELAAHVVGYVGMDDTGLAGLEYALDDAIKGRPGRVLVASDARRRSFYSTDWPGRPGKNVVLALDEKIQYIAAKALAEAVEKWKAAGGIDIVQNPNTGEILALASQPTFNPNEYAQSRPEALVDRGIGWVYEPGSTFKMVTLSAALEEHLTNPQEVINCQQGSIMLAGHVIHDHKPFGGLTVTDVLVHSSDVGAIKLGLRLGDERLYRYVRSFGFGSKTEIELPGEERGLLKAPNRWSGISIGEISMGQEIGVTPLQLASAFSAIANGGILFGPRIVQDVFLDQKHDPLPPVSGRRVVSEQTAALMKQMFGEVVERGTGTPARLNGYSAAGKTGTAQKIDASGRYSRSHYVSSFVGFAPLARPAVTILVVIDSPVGAIYGSEVAAPVFRSIAEQTLGYLNVPQDNPSRWPQIVTSAPAGPHAQKRADRVGLLPPESGFPGAATSTLRPASFSRTVPLQAFARREPEAIPAAHTVVLDDGPAVSVPDFVGWAARRVAEECQKLGLELNASGTGLVVDQDPPAARCVPVGTRVWVRLAR